MNTFVPLLIATVVIGLITSIVIWIVAKLDLGLEVAGFGNAFSAGIVIAFVAGIMTVLLSLIGIVDGDGLIGGIVHLIITVVTLTMAGRLLPGLRVAGIAGVLIVALASGALYWLGGQLLAQII